MVDVGRYQSLRRESLALLTPSIFLFNFNTVNIEYSNVINPSIACYIRILLSSVFHVLYLGVQQSRWS